MILSDHQKQAATHTEGPLRIIAGAGTGKTRTLISRIDHLIHQKGVAPQKILALTFTNKAALEMQTRLKELGHTLVPVMTFHALSARTLRSQWKPDFEILDETQSNKILEEFLMQEEKEKIQLIKKDLSALQEKDLLDIEEIQIKSGLTHSRLQEILEAYLGVLSEKNALDFSSLETLCVMLWNEKPETLTKTQDKYKYILVDEYQDVSALQIEMLKKLVQWHHNLCVVGDPDQTIYTWRGAHPSSLQEFETHFKGGQTILLTENYRNPSPILRAAETLIQKNSGRIEKTLSATKTEGEKLTLWQNQNDLERMSQIFYVLENLVGSLGDMIHADRLDSGALQGFRPFSDIAFLYRTQAEGRKLMQELTKRGYPCQLSAPEEFWKRSEIMHMITGLKKLREQGTAPQESSFASWLSKQIQNAAIAQKCSPRQKENLEFLLNYAVMVDTLSFKDALGQFLDMAETVDEGDNTLPGDKIHLMTLHAAKGLEFPVVMIVGLEEGTLPHQNSLEDLNRLEEERRLLYVGMTRATEILHLFGNTSRFIPEITFENTQPGTLPTARALHIKKKAIKESQMTLF